jgi:hypothetical protein
MTERRLQRGAQVACVARIDAAVEAGDLDESEAADRKAELDDAHLPGYKAAGGNPFTDFGGGGGPGGGHGRGS